STYFLDRRKASASILTEIGESSRKVGLRQRDGAFTFEPIEGSDSLTLMSIAVNFEGSYSDLVEFVHRMDASERFLIIEELQAAPTQVTAVLSIRMRVSAFVREEAPRS
ncbi:MAG: GspMb/PilO family protein, partial [Bryobacteraceae bacterium]